MGRLLVNLLQLVLSSFSLVCSRLYLIFAHMLDFMSDLGLGEGWGGVLIKVWKHLAGFESASLGIALL